MKKREIVGLIKVLSIVLIYIVIINVSNIGCPIMHLTGLPCPTCGVTRAMLALMRLDIKASLGYNPMALFQVASFIIVVINEVIRRKWHWTNYIAISFVSANFIFYVLKITNLLF